MTVKLSDYQMEKILPVLKSFPEIRLGLPRQSRRFLKAVLRITRSGSQWRLFPAEYGNWNSVYKCFARLSDIGIFEKLFKQMVADRASGISVD